MSTNAIDKYPDTEVILLLVLRTNNSWAAFIEHLPFQLHAGGHKLILTPTKTLEKADILAALKSFDLQLLLWVKLKLKAVNPIREELQQEIACSIHSLFCNGRGVGQNGCYITALMLS